MQLLTVLPVIYLQGCNEYDTYGIAVHLVVHFAIATGITRTRGNNKQSGEGLNGALNKLWPGLSSLHDEPAITLT